MNLNVVSSTTNQDKKKDEKMKKIRSEQCYSRAFSLGTHAFPYLNRFAETPNVVHTSL